METGERVIILCQECGTEVIVENVFLPDTAEIELCCVCGSSNIETDEILRDPEK